MSPDGYTLYVIPGSHACRSATLMLDHKQVPYRTVEFVTLAHPVMARLHGFRASGERRTAGGRRTPVLHVADRLGTVPALAAGDLRVSTNRAIARFLDERHPDRPLLPSDPERRARVEEAERWANATLQMEARRIVIGGGLRDPAAFGRATADGRLGYLLYRRAGLRRLVAQILLRRAFAVSPEAETRTLTAMLDRIDGWIADGVLGGEHLNAADFMVAPSLALILYRPDAAPQFDGRPALALVDRLLPAPA